MFPRREAAEILQKVAEAVEYGAWPTDITPFQLGRAVHRTVMNARVMHARHENDDAIIGEFLRGFFHRSR